MTDQARATSAGHPALTVATAIVLGVAGAAGIGFTHHLLRGSSMSAYRTAIEVAEICVIVILEVELVLKAASQALRRRDGRPVGQSARMVVRSLAYLVLLVAAFSMLSANPTLAVGVGSITGIVIGLATQSLFSNAVAGVLLGLGRRFHTGDQILVSGSGGQVTKISLMFTEIRDGEDVIYVPNSVLMASIVRRKPRV